VKLGESAENNQLEAKCNGENQQRTTSKSRRIDRPRTAQQAPRKGRDERQVARAGNKNNQLEAECNGENQQRTTSKSRRVDRPRTAPNKLSKRRGRTRRTANRQGGEQQQQSRIARDESAKSSNSAESATNDSNAFCEMTSKFRPRELRGPARTCTDIVRIESNSSRAARLPLSRCRRKKFTRIADGRG